MNTTSAAVPTYRQRKRTVTLANVIEEEQQRAYRDRIKTARKARRKARKLRRDLASKIARSHSRGVYYKCPPGTRRILGSWLKRQGYEVRNYPYDDHTLEIYLRAPSR